MSQVLLHISMAVCLNINSIDVEGFSIDNHFVGALVSRKIYC